MVNVTLAGKMCVVTGASRGLGRAIAEHLAARGAALGLCARTGTDLESFAASVRAANGSKVIAAPLDICDEEAVRQFAAAVADEVEVVHALINNAGLLGPVGRIDRVPLPEWRQAFAVNSIGVVHATAAFIPLMTRGGSIVNLSGGGIGGPGVPGNISAYTSSKGAVALLTETLAAELAPLGIRVNAIAPGALHTELMRPVVSAGSDRAGARLYESAQQIYDDAAATSSPVLDEGCRALLDFLLDDASWPVTGRLLSARWDRLDELKARLSELPTTSRFTLRRIDGDLFHESERP
jgi:NAD(P)-dependent dehydrogenase (short-subunit alcohol dehydrogenase family)